MWKCRQTCAVCSTFPSVVLYKVVSLKSEPVKSHHSITACGESFTCKIFEKTESLGALLKVSCQSTMSQYTKRGVERSANFKTKRLGKPNNFPVIITLSLSLSLVSFSNFTDYDDAAVSNASNEFFWGGGGGGEVNPRF